MRNLNHLSAFVAIVDAGGFTPAARRLGLTPEAVRKAVVNMEAELGVHLLSRTPRSFSLTDAGEAYLEGCRKVLAAAEEMASALAGYRDGPTGLLRASMPHALGHLHLVPALGGFLDRHPDIKVEVLLTDRHVNGADGSVDVVFQASPLAGSHLVLRTLATPTLRIAASPAYLARRGTPRSLLDLEGGGHECIGRMSPDTGKPVPWRSLAPGGRPEEREVRGRIVVTDSHAELAAAVAGLGLAQMPDHVTCRARAAGDLVEVLHEHSHDGPPISIGHLRDRPLLPKVQVFIDYFVEWFASEMTARLA